jgi:hypothetical protein
MVNQAPGLKIFQALTEQLYRLGVCEHIERFQQPLEIARVDEDDGGLAVPFDYDRALGLAHRLLGQLRSPIV